MRAVNKQHVWSLWDTWSGLEEEWIYREKGDSVLSLRVASTLTVCSCTHQWGFLGFPLKLQQIEELCCCIFFLSALSMAFTCTYTPCVPTWIFVLSCKLVVDISYTESIMFKACWHPNPMSHLLLDTTLYRKFELRYLTDCDRRSTCCCTSHSNHHNLTWEHWSLDVHIAKQQNDSLETEPASLAFFWIVRGCGQGEKESVLCVHVVCSKNGNMYVG